MSNSADTSNTISDNASENSADDSYSTPPGNDAGGHRSRLIESPDLRAGTAYVISSTSCGRMLTLLNGEVVLESGDSLGSPYWRCVKSDEWLGFQNIASGKFLRHGGVGSGLHCSNDQHHRWERFEIRPHETSDKGFTLLMEYWGEMKPVGLTVQNGKEKLDRLMQPGESIAWVFYKVPEVGR